MYVFFFNQKTAYEMRISVWSSDVCSSDLIMTDDEIKEFLARLGPTEKFDFMGKMCDKQLLYNMLHFKTKGAKSRASTPPLDRKSAVSGKSVSVRVELGGRRIIKKKNI